MLNIARVITLIFHPMVLIFPAVFLIVIGSGENYHEASLWTLIAIGFAGIVASYILFGIKKGFFSNFDVSQRKQRIYLFPFIIGVAILFLLSLLLFKGPIELLFAIFYFVIAVSILALVNLKIKASIHVGSVSAVIIGLIYFYGIFLIPLLLIIPVMAWARVVEKKHTVRETVVGFGIGGLLALLGIIIVQYFIYLW